MATLKLLHRAAELAANARLKYPHLSHALGAIGVRKDGAIVHADNGGIRSVGDARVLCGHAERRLSRKLTFYSVVYIARVLNVLSWGMAKPCPVCEQVLRRRHVRRVYYTIAPNEYGVLDLHS